MELIIRARNELYMHRCNIINQGEHCLHFEISMHDDAIVQISYLTNIIHEYEYWYH